MSWASHRGVTSQLPAHIQVVLGIRPLADAPDLAVRTKPKQRRGFRVLAMRGL